MIRSIPTETRFTFGPESTRTGLGRLGLGPDPISTGVSLAVSGIGMWMNSIQLSHDADTATTLIVNGLAEQLQNLLNAYMALPTPTCQDQRAALDAYDNAWLWLQSPAACGNPTYGSAGNRCITDRAPGGKTPWHVYYRDPIANDPRVAALGCDTGEAVILPTVQGGYQQTNLTSSGGNATTGQTAAQIAAANAAAIAQAAMNSAAATGLPASTAPPATAAALPTNTYLFLGVGLAAALLLAREL